MSDAAAARRGPRELFAAFYTIAISGFGGTLPFARRTLVERRGWMTPQDFTETLSLCQSLPGPNIVNMSIVVGGRAAGALGSLAAFSGLVGAPLLIVISMGALYSQFSTVPQVKGALLGLGAAASGLLAATAVRTAEPAVRRAGRLIGAIPFMLAAFVSPRPGGDRCTFPLPYVLAGAGARSASALVWWSEAAAQ